MELARQLGKPDVVLAEQDFEKSMDDALVRSPSQRPQIPVRVSVMSVGTSVQKMVNLVDMMLVIHMQESSYVHPFYACTIFYLESFKS